MHEKYKRQIGEQYAFLSQQQHHKHHPENCFFRYMNS